MKYQILHRYQDSNWMATNLYSTDLKIIIQSAERCARDAIAYGMTAVRDVLHRDHIVEFPAGGGKPCLIHPKYKVEVCLILEQEVVGCPDCKDGFYYPFVGPREPCPTCKS